MGRNKKGKGERGFCPPFKADPLFATAREVDKMSSSSLPQGRG
ncbi:hypothetical protein BV898_12140, partial [Hypsibius exemplaris]